VIVPSAMSCGIAPTLVLADLRARAMVVAVSTT
jgi:hypothetical protein